MIRICELTYDKQLGFRFDSPQISDPIGQKKKKKTYIRVNFTSTEVAIQLT